MPDMRCAHSRQAIANLRYQSWCAVRETDLPFGERSVLTTPVTEDLRAEQCRREEAALLEGLARFRKVNSLTAFQQTFLEDFLDPLILAIRERKESIANTQARPSSADFAILSLDDEHMALISIVSLLHTMSTRQKNLEQPGEEKEPTFRLAALRVGRQCKDQYFHECDVDSSDGAVENLVDSRALPRLLARQKNPFNARRRANEYLEKMKSPEWWDLPRQLAVGSTLLDIALETTGLFQKEYKSLSNHDEKRAAVLSLTEKGTEWLRSRRESRSKGQYDSGSLLLPINMPTIIPPVQWKDLSGGGYYKTPSILVKKNGENYINEDAYDIEHMPQVLSAVNSLQETSWRINQRVLDVIKNCWSDDSLREPLFLDGVKKSLRIESELGIEARIDNCESLSSRPFYFPYQLDFRGRVYAVPQLINTQGDDLTKAVLEFGDELETSDDSEYWIAIQMANSFGIDKLSLSQRYQWCQDNRKAIVSLAKSPQCEFDFWKSANEPWSFLAAAISWSQILDGAKTTALPVYVDGRCNGLQHLSAMSKDEDAAYAVNVARTDVPQDIYTKVAKKLEELVAKDESEWAEYWRGRVDRKLVKKPVMTTPYGVTPEGMKRQLKVAASQYKPPMQALVYLRDKLILALSEAMRGPAEVKQWLQSVARILAKNDQPLVWTVPTGFRVVQDYRKAQFKRLSTQGFTIKYYLPVDGERPVNRQKQELGVIANYVHSMDAAHLIKVVNRLVENDIRHIGVVHDSYGVHAGNVARMNQVIREEFVDMYSKPVLEQFVEEQMQRTGIDLPTFDSYGKLDINEVIESQYFFS